MLFEIAVNYCNSMEIWIQFERVVASTLHYNLIQKVQGIYNLNKGHPMLL